MPASNHFSVDERDRALVPRPDEPSLLTVRAQAATGGDQGPGAVVRLRRALRQRMGRVIVVVLVAMVAGALIGWYGFAPIYSGYATLTVRPGSAPLSLPGSAVDAAELGAQNRMALDRGADDELMILSRPVVVDGALAALRARELGYRDAVEVSADVRRGLRIGRLLGNTASNRMPIDGVIYLSMESRHRDAPHAVIQAVLASYARFRDGEVRRLAVDRLAQAQAAAEEARLSLDKTQAQLDAIQAGVSPLTIEQAHDSALNEYRQWLELLRQTQTAVVRFEERLTGDAPRDPQTERVRLAAADPRFTELLNQQAEAQRELAALTQRMGPNAPALARQRSQVAWLDQQISDYVRRNAPAQSLSTLPPLQSDEPPPLTLADVQQREQRLQTLVQSARLRADDLRRQAQQAALLREDAQSLRRQTTEAQAEVTRLSGEQTHSGQTAGAKITVGEVQPTETRDPRPAMALALAVLGALAGLGVMALIAHNDHRIFRADEAVSADASMPLLGSVPELHPRDPDNDDPELTALAIHEIRAMIQVASRGGAGGAKAFAITSPSKGAGKTSLTVGLASSLAMAQSRTLLVDCDLTNRTLSADYPVRPAADNASGKSSSTFLRAENAEVEAPAPEQRLDSVMLEMGYLDAHDAQLFTAQGVDDIGLIGFMAGESLERCLIRTTVPGLSVLPALGAKRQHIGRMSCRLIRRLIDEAAHDFDIILFDTGPIPGSVEALLAASEVDGVVVVVPRGETQERFNRAMSFLKLVGARVLGTVFNKATLADLSAVAQHGARLSKRKDGSRQSSGGLRQLPGGTTASRGGQHRGSGILAAAVEAQAKPGEGQDANNATQRSSHPEPEAADLKASDAFGQVNEKQR